MSSEIKKAIAECGPGIVATASRNGKPNVSAKGSFRIADDEHVVFADVASPRTIANLRENPQVAAIFLKDRKGARIWGTAEVLTSGPEFDTMSNEMAARDRKLSNLVKIKVEEAIAF